jgi:hypothetical protein
VIVYRAEVLILYRLAVGTMTESKIAVIEIQVTDTVLVKFQIVRPATTSE